MSKIRLSGAQVTRVKEALYQRAGFYNEYATHYKIEDAVEEILNIVTPPMYLINEKGEICQLPNVAQIQNVQPNAND